MDTEKSNLPEKEAHNFMTTLDKKSRFLLSRRLPHHLNWTIAALIILIVIIFIFYLSFFHPPKDFPVKEFIKIEKGRSVEETAAFLAEKNIIKSVGALKFLYKIGLAKEKDTVIAGDYFFESRLPLWSVVRRLSGGDYGIDHIKVTVPEGLSLVQIGKLIESKLQNFNRSRYTLLTRGLEGFLFPDTYFFAPLATEDEVVEEMRQNFENKLDSLRSDIALSGRSVEEIITMASIIEKETITDESKYIVSGILWKRIDNGMKLQVDAVFPYIFGKNSFDFTRTDLQFDSPYNTYRYEGLPPGPIANPGLEAIRAALYPEETSYWFYLSDRKSNMHYARTYDEHLKYKRQYLR